MYSPVKSATVVSPSPATVITSGKAASTRLVLPVPGGPYSRAGMPAVAQLAQRADVGHVGQDTWPVDLAAGARHRRGPGAARGGGGAGWRGARRGGRAGPVRGAGRRGRGRGGGSAGGGGGGAVADWACRARGRPRPGRRGWSGRCRPRRRTCPGRGRSRRGYAAPGLAARWAAVSRRSSPWPSRPVGVVRGAGAAGRGRGGGGIQAAGIAGADPFSLMAIPGGYSGFPYFRVHHDAISASRAHQPFSASEREDLRVFPGGNSNVNPVKGP